MTAVGLIVTILLWAMLWLVGEAAARLLFGPRAILVTPATRYPLGLAATTCVLEATGYFLPIRVAAFALFVPAAFGLFLVVRRRARPSWGVVASGLFALGIGLLPVVIAGRFTAAALTNNDATYYIAAADRLRVLPFRTAFPDQPYYECLSEIILHFWNWRLGTPNLMATASTFSGIGSPASLAVVTALLFACLPTTAIGIARGLGATRGPVGDLGIGLLAACSAGPAFVGYQHMTGHLAACSLFPASVAAVEAAVRRGGARRVVHAALLLGAGVAYFADGASVLIVAVGVVALAFAHRPAAALERSLAVALATALVAPFTLLRAGQAAWTTYDNFRARPPLALRRPDDLVFPQRGWLPRGVIDDAATLLGVDPWPPWPAAWPPNWHTVATWTATVAGLVLLGAGCVRLRRGHRVIALLFAAVVLVVLATLDIHYLRGKVMITATAFTVPIVATGAAALFHSPRLRLVIAPFVLGQLSALTYLATASRWKVVDLEAHDALERELGRLPPGSLVAFDGLGAPTDAVLDAHRAYRAAHRSRLRPIQPGLDGGFYQPRCPNTERPDPLPATAYALQRTSSEHLSQGVEISRWDGFRVLAVDLARSGDFIAAWAPTHGWIAAEREPDGRVFRWAEGEATGTLQVLTPASCASLRGEFRVVAGTAAVTVLVEGDTAHAGYAASEWAAFETVAFSVDRPVRVAFRSVQSAGAPPDFAHALAVRSLSATAVPRCGRVSRRRAPNEVVRMPVDIEESGLELLVVPPTAARCSKISVHLTGEAGRTLRLSVDDGPPTMRYLWSAREVFEVARVESTQPRKLVLTPLGMNSGRWQLEDVVVTPSACE